MIVLSITVLTVEHFSHHAADASDGEAGLLGNSGALPLCRGSAPADRITDIASIEE